MPLTIMDKPDEPMSGAVYDYAKETLGCTLEIVQGDHTARIRLNTPADAIHIARQIERTARLAQERRQETARQRANAKPKGKPKEIERWRRVWRKGFAPQFSTEVLETIAFVLRSDDRRLIQGATTSPPPLMCVQDWPAEASCVTSIGKLLLGQTKTVAEVEEDFAAICFKADQILGEPAACRFFINWYDEVDRDQMRRELLGEVEEELERRKDGNGKPVVVGTDGTPWTTAEILAREA